MPGRGKRYQARDQVSPEKSARGTLDLDSKNLTRGKGGRLKRKPKAVKKTRQTKSDSEIERDAALALIETMSKEMKKMEEQNKKEKEKRLELEGELKDVKEELCLVKERSIEEIDSVIDDRDDLKKDRSVLKVKDS
jgi:predicted transcriptional regulator